MAIRAGSPRPIMKTRAAFYLHTTFAAKLARKLCPHLIKMRHTSRKPFASINVTAVKQECKQLFFSLFFFLITNFHFLFFLGLQKINEETTPTLPCLKPVNRGKVVDVSHKLGTAEMECPEWLIATPKNQLPVPEHLAFPPPEKGKGILF